MSFCPVPSAPLTFVNVFDVTSSSITLQWGPVDCIHRNGNVTGYSVQYWVQGSGSTKTISVSGVANTVVIVLGLKSTTAYFSEVAAVNSAGTGVYSSPTQVISEDKRKSHILRC